MMFRTGENRIVPAGCPAVTGAILAMALAVGSAHAASITNTDGDTHTIPLTEDGVRSEVVVTAGEAVTFCADGCFIIMPNGDRAALLGSESIEIVGGAAIINSQ